MILIIIDSSYLISYLCLLPYILVTIVTLLVTIDIFTPLLYLLLSLITVTY